MQDFEISAQPKHNSECVNLKFLSLVSAEHFIQFYFQVLLSFFFDSNICKSLTFKLYIFSVA